MQFQLAQMATEIEAARMMVYNSARMKDAGRPSESSRDGQAVLFARGRANCVIAIDLFGGNGFTKDYPVEKFFRDAKIGQIYEGTSNMQLQTIAKLVMK